VIEENRTSHHHRGGGNNLTTKWSFELSKFGMKEVELYAEATLLDLCCDQKVFHIQIAWPNGHKKIHTFVF